MHMKFQVPWGDGMAEWSKAMVRLVARFRMVPDDPEVVGSSSGQAMCCVHIQQCDVSWDARHYMSTSCSYDSQ